MTDDITLDELIEKLQQLRDDTGRGRSAVLIDLGEDVLHITGVKVDTSIRSGPPKVYILCDD